MALLNRIWFAGMILLATSASNAHAAGACPAALMEDVIEQAAIDSNCNDEGIYLSVDSFLESARLECSYLEALEGFRICVKRHHSRALLVIKVLERQGLLPAGTIQRANREFSLLRDSVFTGKNSSDFTAYYPSGRVE